MAVEFRANVEEDGAGGWCIRLSDTMKDSSVLCANMDDFEDKLSQMGSEYDNIVEVVWSKNSDVSSEHFYELHQQMAQMKQKIDEGE